MFSTRIRENPLCPRRDSQKEIHVVETQEKAFNRRRCHPSSIVLGEVLGFKMTGIAPNSRTCTVACPPEGSVTISPVF